MPLIVLETTIEAPVERVFDLARSVEVHNFSVRQTKERAIAGRTAGLMQRDDRVTWQGNHFGMRQELEVQITGLVRPHFFEDTMIRGAFAFMRHRHYFNPDFGKTVMRDEFEYSVPFGRLGRFVERSFLTSYMRRFLRERNAILKMLAETQGWKEYLPKEKDEVPPPPRRPYRIEPTGIIEKSTTTT